MSEPLAPAMLELLASKICHDLISPIGAVNNGVELIQELGADAGMEAMELIAFSAAQASAKLQAFRLAYGAGGADGNIKPSDVHHAIEEVVSADKKIRQDWTGHGDFGQTGTQRGFCKILTCMLLLAMETLPKGGTMSVSADEESVRISTRGPDVLLRGHVPDALANNIDAENLEPKDIHAGMTGLLAAHYGFTVSAAQQDNAVEFVISG